MADYAAAKQVSVKTILDSLLAGSPGEIIQAEFNGLPTRVKRQAALCTACGIRAEAAASCQDRGDEIAAFLAANCLLFELGRKPCALQQVYGMQLDLLS
ncbi:MAG TPA: hypothetical protein VMB25_07255 [Bryobacteraceae bacterium]|nr:hypothetical protein [Bryobacteraceae bacterium]